VCAGSLRLNLHHVLGHVLVDLVLVYPQCARSLWLNLHHVLGQVLGWSLFTLGVLVASD
jgi:hypothetical protein